MADSKHAVHEPELSPFQQLQNERIADVADACLKAKMITGNVAKHACAEAVSSIVEKATGEKLRESAAPYMERAGGSKALQHVGHVDFNNASKNRTGDVQRGDFAFYADTGATFNGNWELTHHVGLVTETGAGNVSHIASNASTKIEHGQVITGSFRHNSGQSVPMLGNDQRIEFYRLPATQESVRFMTSDVPHLGDKLKLTKEFTIESLGRDNKPLKEADVPRIAIKNEHDWTKPKDGWSMPGVSQDPNANAHVKADDQFKGIVLQEAMFEAKHGKEFVYEQKPDMPKLTPLQEETLERATLAYLPAKDQDRYANEHNLGKLTAHEFAKPEYGALSPAAQHDAAARMQLAIIEARQGKTDVSEFKAGNGISEDQAAKLNEKLNATIGGALPENMRADFKAKHAPPEQTPQPGTAPTQPSGNTPSQPIGPQPPDAPSAPPAQPGATPTPQQPFSPAPDPPPPMGRRDGFVQSGMITDIKDGVVSQAVGRGKVEQYSLADFGANPPEVGKRLTIAYNDGQATAREPERGLAQSVAR